MEPTGAALSAGAARGALPWEAIGSAIGAEGGEAWTCVAGGGTAPTSCFLLPTAMIPMTTTKTMAAIAAIRVGVKRADGASSAGTKSAGRKATAGVGGMWTGIAPSDAGGGLVEGTRRPGSDGPGFRIADLMIKDDRSAERRARFGPNGRSAIASSATF